MRKIAIKVFYTHKDTRMHRRTYVHTYILLLEIATAKAEVTTRSGHTQTHTSTQHLTPQHNIKSLANREHIDGSTVR